MSGVRTVHASSWQQVAHVFRDPNYSLGLRTTTSGSWLDVPKLDDEDSSSRPVLRNFEEIDDAHKPGLPRELGSDIGEADLEDLCHENLAWWERVPATDLHVWSLP